jgi:hypothetical protein
MNDNKSENGTGANVWSGLGSLEQEIRRGIGAFALNRLSQAARWLERADDLQKRRESLNKEACERLREGKTLLSSTTIEHEQPESEPLPNLEGVYPGNPVLRGGKARGRECRAAYVAQQAKQAKPLARVRGALYRNSHGLVVGIAYAKVRKNEWFLGLPAGQFKEAVLLCEANEAKVQPIRLTESFIEKYGNRLSVSSQYNQAKFNVQLRAGRYYLAVNGIGDVDLTDSVDGGAFVCPHIVDT